MLSSRIQAACHGPDTLMLFRLAATTQYKAKHGSGFLIRKSQTTTIPHQVYRSGLPSLKQKFILRDPSWDENLEIVYRKQK